MKTLNYWINAFDSEPYHVLRVIKQNDLEWEKFFSENKEFAIKHKFFPHTKEEKDLLDSLKKHNQWMQSLLIRK